MKDSDRIVSALQENSERLVRESWLEAWGYRAPDGPLKLSVSHTISPAKDGSYRIKSTIGFGIRVTHQTDAELAKASDSQKLARFPARGDTAAAA